MRFIYSLAAALLSTMVQGTAAADLKIILRYDDFRNSNNEEVDRELFDTVQNIGGGVLVGIIPFPKSSYPDTGFNDVPLPVNLEENKITFLKKYVSQEIVEIAVHGFSQGLGRTKEHVQEGPPDRTTPPNAG